MKQLSSFILALACVIACGQKKAIPENLIGVKEVVAQIDSLATVMSSKEPADSAYNQASLTWAEFKRLVETDEYENALDFYMAEDSTGKKAGDYLVFFRHSSQRYAFFSQVLRPLMSEYKGAEYALEAYVNNLQLEKLLEDATIDLSADTNGYVPEVYPFVVRDLCLGLAVIGEKDEAEGLVSDMARGVYGLTGDVLYCNYVATQLLAQMHMYTDNPEQAKTTWIDFKDYLLENKSDYDEEGLAQCLVAIDAALEELGSL